MNIIVPTDFSLTALNAVIYAANLAKHLNSRIKLLHVVTPYVSKTTFLKIDPDELLDTAVTKLAAEAKRISEDFDVHCTSVVAAGDVAEEILRVASESVDSMIVMGSNKRRYFLFGNITSDVVEKSVVPVLVLPRDMEFTPYSNIVFATDYEPSDLKDLGSLVSIARKFDAKIGVVHVVNRFEEEEEDYDLGLAGVFNAEVKRQIAYANIRCEEYQFTDIPDGIQSYAEEEHADLLVVSTRQKKFIQRLFGKSVTKELLFEFDQPLLIYHATEKEEVTEYLSEESYNFTFS